MTPRLYKALQIEEEGRANLLLLFVILSSFHTLLLSQIVIHFLQIFPFKSSTKLAIVSNLFTNFNKNIWFFDPVSSGIRASWHHVDYSLISKVHKKNLHRAISVVVHSVGQPVSPLVSRVRWSRWWSRLLHLSVSWSMH